MDDVVGHVHKQNVRIHSKKYNVSREYTVI